MFKTLAALGALVIASVLVVPTVSIATQAPAYILHFA